MRGDHQALERIFAACFAERYRTVLVGGADEPLYEPGRDGGPSRVVYREDFVRSALHEVAHWCVAGKRRRELVDYGYWYEPDGRDEAQQAAFEQVEVAPQALEWIFADAWEVAFELSADNVEGGAAPSPAFAEAVQARKARYLREGLPARAARFRDALLTLEVDAGNMER